MLAVYIEDMPKRFQKLYQHLKMISTEIHILNSVLSLLHWDQETFMPPGGIEPRSRQIARMSKLIHEQKTGQRFKRSLQNLIEMKTGRLKAKGLSVTQKKAVHKWYDDYSRENKLPTSFVESFAQMTAEATQIWHLAKTQNNFQLFAPFLEKIIQQSRKKAEILGFENHPYDALIEGYEPCMTTKKLTVIFGSLEKRLKSLIKKIEEKPKVSTAFLHRKIPHEKQIAIGNLLLTKLPIEPMYSRLDLSSHPFSIALHPHDSRITSRIAPHHLMSHLFSILHEAGHSLYEMGLPVSEWGTPLAEATSLTIHESQSRFWETLIGRSFAFTKFFFPYLQQELPFLKKYNAEKFYLGINQVQRSLIRVEADEVTYCLHVIVRFELEKALIEGSLAVVDLPHAWNQTMERILGLKPPSDREGCLQDIHWSLGSFGYFPTYALGNLAAAQFFQTFASAHPNWEDRIIKGDLFFIRDWLKANIHCHGRFYNSQELLKHVTGRSLSEKAFCSYLNKKYITLS